MTLSTVSSPFEAGRNISVYQTDVFGFCCVGRVAVNFLPAVGVFGHHPFNWGPIERRSTVKKLLAAAALIALSAPALAQPAKIMSAPPTGKTINDYYKQSVYDPGKNKIGSVDDMLMSDSGQITALILNVGATAGMGGKDVAVPFDAVRAEKKDNEWYLTVSANENELKSAPGLTFDKTKSAWVPAK